MTPFGPPTTTNRDGAGGPGNTWDRAIATHLRMGNREAADRIQQARARWNIALGMFEPVYVPSCAGRAIAGMVREAAAKGVAISPLAEPYAELKRTGTGGWL
jgi:hypothetical protein